jgi:tetratricopeptide (TPR) repeat protein
VIARTGHRRALAVLVALACVAPAGAEPALEQVAPLIERFHEEPARLDRAREIVEARLRETPDAAAPAAAAELLALLARIHLLDGDARATTREAKIAAYERGREAGRRAVALAPDSDRAHLWFALNAGRLAEANGIMQSLAALPALKRESALLLRLNPRLPEAHTLAASLAAELPRLLGGDREAAERHFLEALRLAPGMTGARVELARLYIASGRHADARRELIRVLDETAPRHPAYWALRDLPRARALLDALPPPAETP